MENMNLGQNAGTKWKLMRKEQNAPSLVKVWETGRRKRSLARTASRFRHFAQDHVPVIAIIIMPEYSVATWGSIARTQLRILCSASSP